MCCWKCQALSLIHIFLLRGVVGRQFAQRFQILCERKLAIFVRIENRLIPCHREYTGSILSARRMRYGGLQSLFHQKRVDHPILALLIFTSTLPGKEAHYAR